MNLEETVSNFNAQVSELKTEEEKFSFSRIANKLLNETFLIKIKKRDSSDYYFVLENFSLFDSFFSIIDYDCVQDKENGLVYIRTSLDRNRVRLTKFETVLCLQLRLDYFKLHKEASATEKMIVTLEVLEESVRNTSIFNPAKKITEYSEALRKLKRLKLIDYENSKISGDLCIEILPSIMVVVSISDLEDINAKLKMLEKDSKAEDEETN